MIDNNTIFALSTTLGKSGVAIIRVSGPNVKTLIRDLKQNIPVPRVATFAKLISPFDGEILDHGMIIFFEGPRSFTGEDLLELQLHGSPSVIDDALTMLSKLPYLRSAEPGEFSKRAFLNGKLDLTRAEGLAQLIDSETSIQRKLALRQLGGELENIYEKWRQEIIKIVAQTEAFIDFPDQDLPTSVVTAAAGECDKLANHINDHLKSANTGISVMKGIEIAIVGAPNVGKSSLLNAIAKRDVAIVSEFAGTTRDVIEIRLNLGGYLITLYDTAGICEAENVIEQEGIRRTSKKIEQSDIIIYVADASRPDTFDCGKLGVIQSNNMLFCVNKSDLNAAVSTTGIATCVSDSKSIELLINKILKKVKENYDILSVPIITNLRYKGHLEQAVESLNFAFTCKYLDLTAFHLRSAATSLGRITGVIGIEEILDTIFSSFCIGK